MHILKSARYGKALSLKSSLGMCTNRKWTLWVVHNLNLNLMNDRAKRDKSQRDSVQVCAENLQYRTAPGL